ncbi:hypothetical protein ACHAWO_012334 [Cyclotella atomus]|uniref:Endonuclease/exonuclease/phosphatase domain-containing protein n=1 Tax=Cyclotella atomus TaxID=382360 RepID=A0ABD3N6E6_9STRA
MFNILSSIHRSIDASHRRESECEDLWQPRMEGVAGYIADTFSKSNVIMLQEWWFDDSFAAIFDKATGHLLFHRITERRPGAIDGQIRDDGLCCLIPKSCKLEPAGQQGTDHLGALSTAAASAATKSPNSRESLQIICGDFNSNSHGSAAILCESNNCVNCASAAAQQMLSSVGERINLGVTHCNHLGEHVSVDHVFLWLNTPKSNNNPAAEPQSTTTGIQTNN